MELSSSVTYLAHYWSVEYQKNQTHYNIHKYV